MAGALRRYIDRKKIKKWISKNKFVILGGLIFGIFYLFVPLPIKMVGEPINFTGLEAFKYLNEKAVTGILSCFMIVGGSIGKVLK
jgi:hypothetical protein